MTSFDQYSDLDSAKLLKEIDDAIVGDVFDQFSVLSPERVRQQLSDNSIEISNAAMLDPSRFTDEVEAAITDIGGGGGGGLPTPPSGFHYMVNADGKYIVNGDDAYVLGR